MSDFPKFVEFHEEGPREGFQIEKTIYPIEERIELINLLSETGLKNIQVGSFVSPKYVPQMMDTGELFKRIRRRDGVKYTALWLNEQGFRKTLSAHNVDIKAQLLFYSSDSFSRKNNNLSAMEMREKQRDWVRLYKEEGLPVERAYVMAAFGCNFEGNIPKERVLDDFRFILDLAEEEKIPVPDLMLADTMGWGNPDSVKRMIGALRQRPASACIFTIPAASGLPIFTRRCPWGWICSTAPSPGSAAAPSPIMATVAPLAMSAPRMPCSSVMSLASKPESTSTS